MESSQVHLTDSSTPDWDYIREQATIKALAIRSQGFIHPATLVPDELEYAEGYKDVMTGLKEKNGSNGFKIRHE